MDTKTDFLIKQYWDNLSILDREIILAENRFWDGFKNYKYAHIPEELKLILMSKIDLKST